MKTPAQASTLSTLVSSLLAAQAAPASTQAAPPAFERRMNTARKGCRRTAHADLLRWHALSTLATRGALTIPEIHATRTETTRANWTWIVTTLTELGLARCIGRGTRHTALLYEITPAGRELLAAEPDTSGVIPPNAGVIADPATH